MSWTLGVDFGTSNTAAAYRVDGGQAQPVRLSDQAEQIPSAVLALDSGVMVGGAAVRSARLDPQRFEPSPKRRLGEGEILLGPREWPVVQLIAEVLAHVRQKAMWVAGGQPPQQLILTYPQQWAHGRKDLLRQAASIAGFDPSTVRLVTEPVAAATWYASTQPVPAGKCVAVFDFGGGTCDVAVLRARPADRTDQPGTFTVLSADGIDPLGGELLDLRLLEWTLKQLADGGNAALVAALSAPENLGALLTLKEQVRHAKHELAEYESARIPVAVGAIQTVVTVTSAEFDTIVGSEIDEAVTLTRRTLNASGQQPADLHALYLTGGSSHLRLVHRRMTELLGRPPATLNDPKLVVAQGSLLVPAEALEAGPAAATPSFSAGPVSVPTGPVPSPAGPPAPGSFAGPVPAPRLPLQTGPVGSNQTGPVGPNQTGPAGPATGAHPTGPQFSTGRVPRPAAPQPPRMPQQAPTAPVRQPRPVAQGAPPHFGPPPFTPVGTPSPPARRTPRWLLPAVAAAVVAIVAVVVVLVVNSHSEQADPDPIATTTGVSTAPTTPTTSESQYQRCPNGTTVGLDDPCPTEQPADCWDGTSAATSAECPALAGKEALEWVFAVPTDAPDSWDRNCKDYTSGEKYVGEAEVYVCTVDKLPDTSIYLSRWDSPTAAQTEFTTLFGAATDFALEVDGDNPASALGWTGPQELADKTIVDARAMVYKDSPFSILVYFKQTDAGKASQDLWFNGQLFTNPDSIAARGTV